MAEPTQMLSIIFRPGMDPFDRHDIEDAIEEALADRGEVDGGGTMVDLSESDISVFVTDIKTDLEVVRAVLQRLQVADTTRIVEFEPERVEHPVYI